MVLQTTELGGIADRRAELESLIDLAQDADDLDLIEQAIADLENANVVDGRVVEPEPDDRTASDRQLDRMSDYRASQSRKANNIGLPDDSGVDWDRRRRAEASLETWLLTYFRPVFTRKFSKVLKRIIQQIEKTLDQGGLKAIGLARGEGKSSILARAALYSLLTGKRRYLAIIGATQGKANKLLKSLKSVILRNPLLRQDYAAELWSFIALNNNAAKCESQHSGGILTGVEWSTTYIDSGYVEGVATNNFRIVALGITSDIRGEQVTAADGSVRRPDAILIDDPQTKKSAGSKPQIKKRYETIAGDVLAMASGSNVAAFALLTIIYKNDLADRLLDREKTKAWRGERHPFILRWPVEAAAKLWHQWETIRSREMDEDEDATESKKFVEEHYDEMHEGSSCSSPERYCRETECSAVHAAYSLKLRDAPAFASEYQLQPEAEEKAIEYDITVDSIAKRRLDVPPGQVPVGCDYLTAFVDVQKYVLYYGVIAWAQSGRGYVIDVGALPDQGTHYWTKQSLSQTMQEVAHTQVYEDALSQCLDLLIDTLMGQEYVNQDGRTVQQIDKLGIDAGYAASRPTVRRLCRESIHKNRLHPSFGLPATRKRTWSKTMSKAKKRDKGVDCFLERPPEGERGVKELKVDTSAWKTRTVEALVEGTASPRALVFSAFSELQIRMIGEHCVSEEPVLNTTREGDEYTTWITIDTNNDLWDCIVGASAVSSLLGIHKPRAVTEARKSTESTARVQARRPASKSSGSFSSRLKSRLS